MDLQELRDNCCSTLKQKYELDKKAEEVMVNYIKSYVKEKGVKEKNVYTLEPKGLWFFYNDWTVVNITSIVYTERSNEQDPKSNIEIYGTSRYGYEYFSLDRYFRFKEIENVFNILK